VSGPGGRNRRHRACFRRTNYGQVERAHPRQVRRRADSLEAVYLLQTSEMAPPQGHPPLQVSRPWSFVATPTEWISAGMGGTKRHLMACLDLVYAQMPCVSASSAVVWGYSTAMPAGRHARASCAVADRRGLLFCLPVSASALKSARSAPAPRPAGGGRTSSTPGQTRRSLARRVGSASRVHTARRRQFMPLHGLLYGRAAPDLDHSRPLRADPRYRMMRA
jgi:hypothetical protein